MLSIGYNENNKLPYTINIIKYIGIVSMKTFTTNHLFYSRGLSILCSLQYKWARTTARGKWMHKFIRNNLIHSDARPYQWQSKHAAMNSKNQVNMASLKKQIMPQVKPTLNFALHFLLWEYLWFLTNSITPESSVNLGLLGLTKSSSCYLFFGEGDDYAVSFILSLAATASIVNVFG